MNENVPVLLISIEERTKFLQDWYESFGVDRLISHIAEQQMFMSARCKEHRATIKQLTEQVAALEAALRDPQ